MKLDQIVATYAPRGARQKRQRLIRRISVAAGLVVIFAGGALVSISDVGLSFGNSADNSTVAGYTRADAKALADDKARFAARIAELERQIAGVMLQKQDLEIQQSRLVEQGEALAKLLNDAGARQTDLANVQQHGSQLDQEIAAIAAQRKALEKRWAQFEAQGELLALEIVAVNAQRKELESQRQQIDRQQRELAELLERADGLYGHTAKPEDMEEAHDESTTAVNETTLAYTDETLMVGNKGLDEMRGGFRTGKGLDVSFGFTQTGSLNGVEQFSNRFTIDSMASGMDDADLSSMNSVLLQNGSGNFVEAGVLESLSDSFGSVIQNTLDDQVISTTTIYDFDLHNVSDAMQGIYGEQALIDSLSRY